MTRLRPKSGQRRQAGQRHLGRDHRHLYDVDAAFPVLLEDGTREYVWGLGLAYAAGGSGTVEVYHGDGLGSTRALSDAGLVVTDRYEIDELGVPTTTTGANAQGMAVSLVTLGEFHEDASSSAAPEAELEVYRPFLLPFRKIGPTEPIVERVAELRAFLRRRGRLISDFDSLLAAAALEPDLTVLTFNTRRFRPMPDLRLYPAS